MEVSTPAHSNGAILPALLIRFRQADRAVCFPLVQGAYVASSAKTDAFLWRQVANSAEISRVLVHAIIITGSRANFKSGLMQGYVKDRSTKAFQILSVEFDPLAP